MTEGRFGPLRQVHQAKAAPPVDWDQQRARFTRLLADLHTRLPECWECGTPFRPRPNERFCSQECRRARHRRQNEESRIRRKRRGPGWFRCHNCGTFFTKSDKRTVCSDRCRRERFNRQCRESHARTDRNRVP